MSEKIKLSENVMLIDVAFLNFVVMDLKKHFERALKRPLQEIDLTELVTYLVLDAGLEEGQNQVQLLMIYDKESSNLQHCSPSDVRKELDGVAFKNQIAEFTFCGVPCEEMVSREDLFIDLLNIVSDSADVKRMIVLSFNEEYGQTVLKALKKVKGKEIIQLRMNEPDESVEYRWEMLAYPVMQSLGIRGDEI